MSGFMGGTLQGTARGAEEHIAKMAAQSFADHELTQETEDRWLCMNPARSSYWFRVLVCPGVVIIYGDVGEGIFYSTGTGIAWLREAVKDSAYLRGKLKPNRDHEDFYSGDCIAWALEMNREDLVGAAKLYQDALRFEKTHGLDREGWADLVLRNGFDSEACAIGMGPAARTFWLVEALRVFVKLVDARAAVVQ